jgi:hypothetical protein
MKRKSILMLLVSIVCMLSLSSCCCWEDLFGPPGHGPGGPGGGGGWHGAHPRVYVEQPTTSSDITTTPLPEQPQ